MSTAGSWTVDATGQKIYEDTDGCTTFLIRCLASSANDALVNIPGLHDAGEFFPIPPGQEYPFRLNHLGIREVFVKGDGGNADISGGIVAKTYAH